MSQESHDTELESMDESIDDNGDRSRSPLARERRLAHMQERASVSASRQVICKKLLPRRIIQIMVLLLTLQGAPRTVDSVELFAGCRSVTNGIRGLGYSAVGLDFSTISYWDNINSTTGFLKALTYVMGLAPDGFLWAAPPCSSWVWMARGSSGRSKEQPLGRQSHEKVRQANEQISRVVLLLLVAMLLHNAIFMAEQPASTLLPFHPRWQMLLKEFQLFEVNLWMQPYGGTSPKRTWLCSNKECIQELCLPLDPSIQTTVVTSETKISPISGKTSVTGTKDLKSTQAYPSQFGKAVARTYANAVVQESFGDGVALDELEDVPCSTDSWDDAGLQQVLADLQKLQESRISAEIRRGAK